MKKNETMLEYEKETGFDSISVDYDSGCWVRSGGYIHWLESKLDILMDQFGEFTHLIVNENGD
jgi:hypothetical protein